AFGSTSQLELANPLRQRLQHYFSFEPGKQLTNTCVNARAKSHMPESLALDVVAVRIAPLSRIPVCRPEKHQYFAIGFERHTTKLRRSCSRAEEGLDGGFETN